MPHNIMHIHTVGNEVSEGTNPFIGLLPSPNEIDLKSLRFMDGISGLGVHFATSMRQGLMPIDVAMVGTDETKVEKYSFERRGSRLPMWLVLVDTNLTGSSLFEGYAYTPTGYEGLEARSATKQEIDTLPKNDFRGTDVVAVSSTEKAVGLDGLGRFVNLIRRTRLGTFYNDYTVETPQLFSVSAAALKPSDFFDLETELSSEQLVEYMQDRMEEAILKYTAKLVAEKSKLNIDEPLDRPIDYYDARTGIVDRAVYPTPAEEPRKRRFIDRILEG